MATSSSSQNNANAIYFDHITCNVCLEVLEDPVQCVKNEHHFCKKCITKHLARSKTCPVCQDALTSEMLRPTSRIVASLLQQFQSPKCKYASRGCTTNVSRESLLSHHNECGFAPVQCSHEGCEVTVNRQDANSHLQKCEFRLLTCDDCLEVMKQREYRKHGCFLRKEVDENKAELAEVKKILREIQDEQVRQGVEIKRLACKDLGQISAIQENKGDNSKQPANVEKQPSLTQEQRSCLSEVASVSPNQLRPACSILNPIQIETAVKRKIVVAGNNTLYEVFDWSTHKWTVYKNTLFFCHQDTFSFVYDDKIMICSGRGTNRIDCLDVGSNSSNAYPSLLPSDCGKGVLFGDKIFTFGQVVSATSLKPPFKTAVLNSYVEGQTLSSYGVAVVNKNAVALVGGYKKKALMSDHVLLYNPSTKCFTSLAPLPKKLADMAVVVHKDNLIILGGKNSGSSYYGSKDVLMYNITNQLCRKLPCMLQERSRCTAVILGDTIVVIGGVTTAYRRDCSSYCSTVKTAEYLVLGEDTWKKLPDMHWAKDNASACLLP